MDDNEKLAWQFFREVFLDPEKREALRFMLANHLEMKRMLEAEARECH